MKRKQWNSKTKWLIVLEGLKGKSVAEICIAHQVSQSQYYKWRDQFLSDGHTVFDQAKDEQREAYLTRENERLKQLVGDLTYELKKRRALGVTQRRSTSSVLTAQDQELLVLIA